VRSRTTTPDSSTQFDNRMFRQPCSVAEGWVHRPLDPPSGQEKAWENWLENPPRAGVLSRFEIAYPPSRCCVSSQLTSPFTSSHGRATGSQPHAACILWCQHGPRAARCAYHAQGVCSGRAKQRRQKVPGTAVIALLQCPVAHSRVHTVLARRQCLEVRAGWHWACWALCPWSSVCLRRARAMCERRLERACALTRSPHSCCYA